jgi:hypothetical protein
MLYWIYLLIGCQLVKDSDNKIKSGEIITPLGMMGEHRKR